MWKEAMRMEEGRKEGRGERDEGGMKKGTPFTNAV